MCRRWKKKQKTHILQFAKERLNKVKRKSKPVNPKPGPPKPSWSKRRTKSMLGYSGRWPRRLGLSLKEISSFCYLLTYKWPWVQFLCFKCSLNCSINFALEKERALCEPAVALCLWQVSFVNPPYNPSIYAFRLNLIYFISIYFLINKKLKI